MDGALLPLLLHTRVPKVLVFRFDGTATAEMPVGADGTKKQTHGGAEPMVR